MEQSKNTVTLDLETYNFLRDFEKEIRAGNTCRIYTGWGNKIEFWFCWYNSQGQWFLPIKNIRGKNRLQYVHQLQNLFYQLSGFDLVLR